MPKYPKGSVEMKQYMAQIRAMRKNKKGQSMKGKGILNDLMNTGKDYATSMVKNKAKELVDVGAKKLKEKIGSSFLGDLGKTVLKTGLNVVPIPGIARDIAQNVGDLVIDKTIGGNLNAKNMLVGRSKSVMVKKNMAGGALNAMGKGMKML